MGRGQEQEQGIGREGRVEEVEGRGNIEGGEERERRVVERVGYGT